MQATVRTPKRDDVVFVTVKMQTRTFEVEGRIESVSGEHVYLAVTGINLWRDLNDADSVEGKNWREGRSGLVVGVPVGQIKPMYDYDDAPWEANL